MARFKHFRGDRCRTDFGLALGFSFREYYIQFYVRFGVWLYRLHFYYGENARKREEFLATSSR